MRHTRMRMDAEWRNDRYGSAGSQGRTDMILERSFACVATRLAHSEGALRVRFFDFFQCGAGAADDVALCTESFFLRVPPHGAEDGAWRFGLRDAYAGIRQRRLTTLPALVRHHTPKLEG